MPKGVHLRKPVAYRPPEDVRDWLLANRDERGEAVNAVITEALRDLIAKRDAEQRASA